MDNKHVVRAVDEDVDLERDLKQLEEVFAPQHPEPIHGTPQIGTDVASKIETLRKVLDINLKYQTFLREQIDQIEALLALNSEKKRLISQMNERSTSKGAKRHAIPRKAVFSAPYFVDQEGKTPPENPDTIRKRRQLRNAPTQHKFIRWSTEERTNLEIGIRHQTQAFLMKQAVNLSNSNMNQMNANINPTNDLTIFGNDQDGDVKQRLERIKQLTDEELLLNTDHIDWGAIANNYVHTRTATDCKIQWSGNDDPRINKEQWTKAEDKKLFNLVEEMQARDWIEIARRLQTNRTAMQCFSRFQRSLNSNFIRSKWKSEEDEKLKEQVTKYGEKNWQQVASKMKMRTDQQCLHRWTKSVNPAIRSGRWLKQEDLRLKLAVQAYGAKNWSKIQRHVPGRTDVKCRERWVNVLNPLLNKKKWTPQEDADLMRLTQEYGLGSWTKIAKHLPPRTDNQCWRRWKKLTEKPVLDNYRKNLEIKRRVLVRNFVGRQKERSQLTAQDFGEQPQLATHHSQQANVLNMNGMGGVGGSNLMSNQINSMGNIGTIANISMNMVMNNMNNMGSTMANINMHNMSPMHTMNNINLGMGSMNMNNNIGNLGISNMNNMGNLGPMGNNINNMGINMGNASSLPITSMSSINNMGATIGNNMSGNMGNIGVNNAYNNPNMGMALNMNVNNMNMNINEQHAIGSMTPTVSQMPDVVSSSSSSTSQLLSSSSTDVSVPSSSSSPVTSILSSSLPNGKVRKRKVVSSQDPEEEEKRYRTPSPPATPQDPSDPPSLPLQTSTHHSYVRFA